MLKLATMAVISFALVAMGCQAGAPRPPEAPQGGVAHPPPPPGGGHDTMARHPGPGPGGPEAREHKKPRGGDRMARGDRKGERAMRAPKRAGRAGPGRPMGRMGPGPGNMHPGGPPGPMQELAGLGIRFYPPPMLIKRAQEIGLTPDQVSKIRQEVLTAKSRAVDLHAKVEHAKVEGARLLAADKVDDKAVNAQIDEAAKAQAELHKLHLGTMLRVRALLTPEQRQKLDAPRPPRPHAGAKPGAAPPGPVSALAGDDLDDDDGDDDDDDVDDDDAEA